MTVELFSSYQLGNKYKRKGWLCQDYAASKDLGFAKIIAVADGHGSYDCFRSHIGSKFAVEIAIDMICCGTYFKLHEQIESTGVADDNNQDYESQVSYKNSSITFSEKEVDNFKMTLWSKWRQRVRDDWNDKLKEYEGNCVSNDLAGVIGNSEERFKTVSEKYRERYLSKEKAEQYLYVAYGTTLILAICTETCTLLLQIGDGTCVVLYGNGKFDTPIPVEEKNSFNVTTSLCEDNAYLEIRHKILTKDSGALDPVAVFLSSDGIDDCYPVYRNAEYLYRLYKVILSDFVKCSSSADIKKVEEEISDDLLPYMTNTASQDDVSLAFIVNMNKLKNALALVKLDDMQQDKGIVESRTCSVKSSSKSIPGGSDIGGSHMLRSADKMRRRCVHNEEAFECYCEPSKNGHIHPGSLYWIGWYYESGICVSKSIEQAKEFYNKAFDEAYKLHEEGSKDDCLLYVLGACYGKGKGVEQNIERAKEYYKEAAELGYPEAKYEYALLCNDDDKEKYLTEAVNLGLMEAEIELGCFKYEHRNYDSAYDILDRVVGLNKSRQFVGDLNKATYYLARIYHKKKNYDKAIKYYESVKRDFPSSFFYIGMCYIEKCECKLAVGYLREALSFDKNGKYIGDIKYYLAFCYFSLKYFVEAINCCRQSLDNGYNSEKANHLLSNCLYSYGENLLNDKSNEYSCKVSDIISELRKLNFNLADKLDKHYNARVTKTKRLTNDEINGVPRLETPSIDQSRKRYREALREGKGVDVVRSSLSNISKYYKSIEELGNSYRYEFLLNDSASNLVNIYSRGTASDLLCYKSYYKVACVKEHVDKFLDANNHKDKADALVCLANIFEKGEGDGIGCEVELAYSLYDLANCLGSEDAYKALSGWYNTKKNDRERALFDMDVCIDIHLYYQYIKNV